VHESAPLVGRKSKWRLLDVVCVLFLVDNATPRLLPPTHARCTLQQHPPPIRQLPAPLTASRRFSSNIPPPSPSSPPTLSSVECKQSEGNNRACPYRWGEQAEPEERSRRDRTHSDYRRVFQTRASYEDEARLLFFWLGAPKALADRYEGVYGEQSPVTNNSVRVLFFPFPLSKRDISAWFDGLSPSV
jgi:hypothetical protein